MTANGDTNDSALLRKLLAEDRSAVVGKMSGTLVHGMNNYLGAVIGYIDLMMLNPESERFSREIEQILASSNEGIRLVGELATVRNALIKNLAMTEVPKLLNALLELLRGGYSGMGIEVATTFPDSCRLYGDAAVFAQAAFHFLNSGYISARALPEGKRRLECILEAGEEAVAVVLRAVDGYFAAPQPAGELSPDDAAYDFWLVEQLPGGSGAWTVSPDGCEQRLTWGNSPLNLADDKP